MKIQMELLKLTYKSNDLLNPLLIICVLLYWDSSFLEQITGIEFNYLKRRVWETHHFLN